MQKEIRSNHKEEEMSKVVSARKAAEILGVDHKTVKAWVKSGRLPGKIRKVKTVREFITIPERGLEHAFTCICVWCGIQFQAKHPGQAKYCCREHKDRYLYQLKKKKRKK